jgi:enhancing lycopene biosynthesis protein 2
MVSFRGEPRVPDGDASDLGGLSERSVEERVRQQVAAEILDEVDRVVAAPAHVYAQRIAELSAGPVDRVFWDGLLEGMLIAADVVAPRHEPPAD